MQADSQVDRQTDRRTDRQTDRQTEVVEVPKSSHWELVSSPLPEGGKGGKNNTGIYFPQFELRQGVSKGKGQGKTQGNRKGKGAAPGAPDLKSPQHFPDLKSDEDSKMERWSFGYCLTKKVAKPDRPNWQNQVNRFLVPCVDNPDKHWLRSARGISLGMLFFVCGIKWSAKSIYMFYMSCRVLALKQGRTKSTGAQIFSFWEMQQRLQSHVLKYV